MKKTLIFTVSLLMGGMIMAQKPNTLTRKEKKEGWKLLFDGHTTKGWHTYLRDTVGAKWQVKDDALVFDPTQPASGGGDIVTNDEYENFELRLEWKVAKGSNSGIIFDIQEDPKYSATYLTGPEMQVLDNNGHSDGKIHKHRAGDLYDLIPCTKETVRPVGEWNEAEIISKNGSLKLFLNGVNVVSTTMWDDQWKTLVAGSKFKQWPDFGSFRRGKIDLQDHGNEVWYRNIKIKEL